MKPEQNCQAYCKKRLISGSWGKDLEIFALANIYNVAINVYYKEPTETLEQAYRRYKARFIPVDGDIQGDVNIFLMEL